MLTSISGSDDGERHQGGGIAGALSGAVRITSGGRVTSRQVDLRGRRSHRPRDRWRLEASTVSGSVAPAQGQGAAGRGSARSGARGSRTSTRCSARGRPSAAASGSAARCARGGRYELKSFSGEVTPGVERERRIRSRRHVLQRRRPLGLPVRHQRGHRARTVAAVGPGRVGDGSTVLDLTTFRARSSFEALSPP